MAVLPRNENGQFLKGYRYSLVTEFKRGQGYWTGKKRSPRSLEWRTKLGLVNKGGNKTSFKKGQKVRLGIKHTKESKRKISIHKLGQKAWNKGKKHTKISRENHWNWKGGINPINDNIRHSLEYKLWRVAVFTKDNFTCQKCGKHGGDMEAHHIKPFSIYPELRFAIDNGKTFCVNCHQKINIFSNFIQLRKESD